MAQARLEPGAVLDGFTIGPIIHSGGMAVLHEVSHPGMTTPLILKAPRMGEGEDPAAIVSFEMEQMILPRLIGPHVPKVFGVGDFSHQPYLVLERLPEPSLFARLPELPLPPAAVAALGAKVATALDSLHRQEVIHLDIKPSNILFRPTGEAVLIDYGLAHHTALPDLMAEEFRLPYGSAPYMAPEQTLGVRSYRRSDIFALGALMYFFAVGERPFGDPQSLKGLRRRIWEAPDPPRRVRPEIPAWLQEVILTCLEPEPDRRYPTAAQLAFALNHPDQIALTDRAERRAKPTIAGAMARRMSADMSRLAEKLARSSKLASAPIIAVAIDLAETGQPLAEALRQMVQRTLLAMPEARVACVNVLKLNAVAADKTLDEAGRNRHVQRLIELKDWAEPMGLAADKVTFHVLEAVRPAEAILDYARANHVDHIIMGARAESAMRRVLGSVSSEVAGHAPCTVTVVRTRQRPDPGDLPAAA